MAVAKFLPHLRNEFAIHRWDIVGDEDTSNRLLAQSSKSLKLLCRNAGNRRSVSVLGLVEIQTPG